MGRYVVKVPDIGEGMTEAEIVAWHVAPGQVIREEDPLVDVMTDKATVELPAPIAGTVVAIHGTPGEKRPVGSELVELDVVGAVAIRELEDLCQPRHVGARHCLLGRHERVRGGVVGTAFRSRVSGSARR